MRTKARNCMPASYTLLPKSFERPFFLHFVENGLGRASESWLFSLKSFFSKLIYRTLNHDILGRKTSTNLTFGRILLLLKAFQMTDGFSKS